jgi:hypothetical protein
MASSRLLSLVDVETGQAVESGGGVTTDDDGFFCFWVVHRSRRVGRHQTLKLFRGRLLVMGKAPLCICSCRNDHLKNVKLTPLECGVHWPARLYRVASSNRRERGRPPG